MAKKMTPGQLRAKAKAMLEQAKIEEDRLFMNAGKLAFNELNKDAADSFALNFPNVASYLFTQ